MPTYTESWDETKPAGTRDLSLGDDDIRELKRALRERLGSDHQFAADESGDGNIGYHKKITFPVQTSDPAAVADAFLLYSKDDSVDSKAHLFMQDEDGNTQQLTALVNTKLSWIGGIPGEVRYWSGTIANIPAGWVICDGNNGSPNLIAKFIRGVATAATDPGGTGGADTVDLSHTHSGLSHTHTFTPNSKTEAGGGGATVYAEASQATTGSSGGSTGSALSAAQSILPTYHELAPIYKT